MNGDCSNPYTSNSYRCEVVSVDHGESRAIFRIDLGFRVTIEHSIHLLDVDIPELEHEAQGEEGEVTQAQTIAWLEEPGVFWGLFEEGGEPNEWAVTCYSTLEEDFDDDAYALDVPDLEHSPSDMLGSDHVPAED